MLLPGYRRLCDIDHFLGGSLSAPYHGNRCSFQLALCRCSGQSFSPAAPSAGASHPSTSSTKFATICPMARQDVRPGESIPAA